MKIEASKRLVAEVSKDDLANLTKLLQSELGFPITGSFKVIRGQYVNVSKPVADSSLGVLGLGLTKAYLLIRANQAQDDPDAIVVSVDVQYSNKSGGSNRADVGTYAYYKTPKKLKFLWL